MDARAWTAGDDHPPGGIGSLYELDLASEQDGSASRYHSGALLRWSKNFGVNAEGRSMDVGGGVGRPCPILCYYSSQKIVGEYSIVSTLVFVLADISNLPP